MKKTTLWARHGQSAMEYMTTYGWALLAVVAAIAVLLSFNVLHAPEQCVFDDNTFLCQDVRLMSEDVDSGLTNLLYATITNGKPDSMQIIGIACAGGYPPARDGPEFSSPLFKVPSGGQDQPLTLGQRDSFNTAKVPQNRFRAQCFELDSAGEVRPMFLRPGSYFQGTLYVLYRPVDDASAPPKLVTGRLVAGVQ